MQANHRLRPRSLATIMLLLASVFAWRVLLVFRGAARGLSTGMTSTENHFVGATRCADCHQDITSSHQLSGHARTFTIAGQHPCRGELIRFLGEDSTRDDSLRYQCDDSDLSVVNRRWPAAPRLPVQFALGSGERAVTFLSLLAERDGAVAGLEHRWTWYRHLAGLDLTLGHGGLTADLPVESFGKLLSEEETRRCLDCHTTTYELSGTTLAALLPGVQCESCHGAGAAHVACVEAGDSSGARAAIQRAFDAAAELQLCGDCHRRTEDIDPERWTREPDVLARFQPAGLARSSCYQQSDGRLRCTTCHDPHAANVSGSREATIHACLSCHGATGRVCPQKVSTGCIECHMPSVPIARGLMFHDHWIRVRAGRSDVLDAQRGDE